MSTELQRISELAKQDQTLQFTSLAHLLTVEMLGEAYRRLRKDASPGVDGLTTQEYEQDLAGNLQDLHRRPREGRYRAQPVRRVYIEQEGKRRPLGIPALEDADVVTAQPTYGLGRRADHVFGPFTMLRNDRSRWTETGVHDAPK